MVQRPARFIFSIFIFSMTPAFAQREILDMSLEELLDMKVVTASKREVKSMNVAALVTVLTADELGKGGAENLADGLRFASGVNVRKAPGSFPQYSVAIRGNVSDFMNMRTLFLVDGIPVKNINGGFDPGWIPLSMIQRVEIVKGPNSNLYGANAFGGVINVITKNGKDFNEHLGDVSLGYHSRHDHINDDNIDGHFGSFNLGKKSGKFDYFVSGQYIQANDSKENFTGYKNRDAYAKLSYEPSENVKHSLRALVSQDQNQIGLTYASEQIKNNFTHLVASSEIQLDAHSSLKFSPYVNLFSHDLDYANELRHYDNEATSIGLNSQYTTTINDLHLVVAGVDFANEYGMLDTHAFDYTNFPPTLQDVGWNRRHQSTLGTYLQYEYEGWEKFRPTVGLRYDKNSLFGSALSPRVSFSYLKNKNLSIYASAGRGFRAPVFNETHINGYGKIGDNHLKPETIMTYEVGLKSVQSNSQNALSFFHQSIREKISLEFVDPSDPASLQTYKNIGTSKVYGMEFEGSYNLTKTLRAFYNSMLLKSDDGHEERVERLIESKFVLGLDYSWETWSFWIAGIQEGNQFFYNTNDAIPDESGNRYFISKQVTGNVEVTKRFDASSLSLYVNNFTNLKYRQWFSPFEEQNDMVLPGRKVGLTFKTQF